MVRPNIQFFDVEITCFIYIHLCMFAISLYFVRYIIFCSDSVEQWTSMVVSLPIAEIIGDCHFKTPVKFPRPLQFQSDCWVYFYYALAA